MMEDLVRWNVFYNEKGLYYFQFIHLMVLKTNSLQIKSTIGSIHIWANFNVTVNNILDRKGKAMMNM